MNSETNWAYHFFNSPDYLELYKDMTGPRRTRQELSFCRRALNWLGDERILDVPCGAGRHDWELAKRGYRTVGVDFSEYLLEKAQRHAGFSSPAAAAPQFIRGQMQQLPLKDNTFDSLICLFSSFGYGETDEENIRILREFCRVLKPEGKAVIDVMNRNYVAPRLNTVFESVQHGVHVREERTVTHNGRRFHNQILVRDPHGNQRRYLYYPWLFNGWELSWMATQAGMTIERLYGNFDGERYTEDSERAMLVARKHEA